MSEKRFSGASYDKHRDRWMGRITFNGERYQKYFKTKDEAEKWYHDKSIELHNADVVLDLEPKEVFDIDTIRLLNETGGK